MNDLKVRITGDESGFDAAMAKTRAATRDYQDFWKQTLNKQEDEEVRAAVAAAKRSNQARKLMRQRANEATTKQAITAEAEIAAAVEKAHRANLAARLRRERAAARELREIHARENSFLGRAGSTVRGGVNRVGGFIAGFASVYAVQSVIRKTAEYASQLTDLSARTGVSVESLQRLDRAAKENGTSLDALVGLWERVGSAREDALRDKKGGAAKAFGALGVNSGMLQSGSPDEIVRKIADSFQNSTNVEQLIAPLREIGGRGAGQMITLFREGLDQQYQDMQVMTAAQADILDELDDKWSTLGQRISIGVVPWLVKLIDGFTWLQDKIVSILTALMVESDAVEKGRSPEEALRQGMEAAAQSESENKAEQEAQDKARADRVAKRLAFGKFDPASIEANKKEKRDKFAISEMKLDELSKAGLFAGGAGMGMMNNYPEKQLAATEKLVEEVKKSNTILEEGLGG